VASRWMNNLRNRGVEGHLDRRCDGLQRAFQMPFNAAFPSSHPVQTLHCHSVRPSLNSLRMEKIAKERRKRLKRFIKTRIDTEAEKGPLLILRPNGAQKLPVNLSKLATRVAKKVIPVLSPSHQQCAKFIYTTKCD